MTRSSATAEKQRVIYACFSRLANSSQNSLNMAAVIMIVAQVVLTQCPPGPACDRRRDGFTIANAALCTASYADAL